VHKRQRRFRPLLSLVFVLAAAVTTFAPSSAAAAVSQVGPLPPCTYDDVQTPYADYSEWDMTLVDTYFTVGDTYVPPDLVKVANAGISGRGKVRSLAIADLAAMAAAAKAKGKPIAVNSAYRSYTKQASTFQYYVDLLGYDGALLRAARPGHSEHQLGVAIDFKSKRTSDVSPGGDWALSKAGKWMANHAWQYGWVMSYPKDKTSVTCYEYEPWHYRYFGRTVAAEIHYSGLTTREWLWQQGYGLPKVEPLAPAA
jgi:D-alanyl-D-alanine carboxypeptidase